MSTAYFHTPDGSRHFQLLYALALLFPGGDSLARGAAPEIPHFRWVFDTADQTAIDKSAMDISLVAATFGDRFLPWELPPGEVQLALVFGRPELR